MLRLVVEEGTLSSCGDKQIHSPSLQWEELSLAHETICQDAFPESEALQRYADDCGIHEDTAGEDENCSADWLFDHASSNPEMQEESDSIIEDGAEHASTSVSQSSPPSSQSTNPLVLLSCFLI